MNALFDTEGLRAAHRGQFSLDLLAENDETPAELPLDEQPVVVEHRTDELFTITLGGEPADAALFGFTIPNRPRSSPRSSSRCTATLRRAAPAAIAGWPAAAAGLVRNGAGG